MNNLSKKARRLTKRFFLALLGKKQKNVINIPVQLRFGNLLYFFMHAYKHKSKNIFILHNPTMDYWLEYFPNLKQFIIHPNQFKKFDNIDWFTSYYQTFGVDFTKNDLDKFIIEVLAKNDIIVNSISTKDTVINIRRGDFYINRQSTPSSFDQIKYIEQVASYYPDLFACSVVVVSDDIKWCKDNLKIQGCNIIYKDSSPILDFLNLCCAGNLILTNSTFSYWGGYVNHIVNGKGRIIAPNFGSTLFKNQLAYQLDPDWTIVDVINKNI